jgi:type I restriction-modification system DNA methylase subunit
MALSKQQLGSLLWGIADTGLRSKVEDYKAYILSLLFFKRLSDNYGWETAARIKEFEGRYGTAPNEKQLERPKRRRASIHRSCGRALVDGSRCAVSTEE